MRLCVHKRILLNIVVILFGSVLAEGCYFTHYTNLQSQVRPPILDRVDRAYEEIGVVHAETWTTTLFWVIPFTSSLDDAQSKLRTKAVELGADAIINVEAHVDNRNLGGYLGVISGRGWGIPWIIGSTDYHISGLAIKFLNNKGTGQ